MGLSAREVGHRPAIPEDPRDVGMAQRVRPDRVQVIGQAVAAFQAALQAPEPRLHGVGVRVAETRGHRPPVQIDHARGRSDGGPDLGVTTDPHDPAGSHRDRGDEAALVVHRGDPAVHEDQVGRLIGWHRPSMAGVARRAGRRIPPVATG